MSYLSLARKACYIVLFSFCAFSAPAQLQPLARYEGKLLPVVDYSRYTFFVLEKSKKREVKTSSVELRPGTAFHSGVLEITNIRSDLDPQKNADPKGKSTEPGEYFRYEADVLAPIELKECYGLLTFVVNGSVGTHYLPIGKLTPGKSQHIDIVLDRRVDSLGLLHVFAEGLELQSNLVPKAYDAQEYFTSLTQGTKGIGAIALCHTDERYPHVLSLDGSKLATTRKRDTHNSLLIFDLKSMSLLKDVSLGTKGEHAWDLTWVSDHELAYIYDDPEAVKTSSSLGLLDIQTGKTEKLEGYVDNILTLVKNHPELLAVYGTQWRYHPGTAKYDLKQRRIASNNPLEEGTTTFDDNGDGRIRFEDDGDGYVCYYKATADAPWRSLDKNVRQPGLKFDQRGKGYLDRTTVVHSIGPDGDTLYFSSRLNSDRFELAALSLSKGEIIRTIAINPKFDLTSDEDGLARLLFRKGSSELIGLLYNGEKPHVLWLDPAFEAAQKMINQSLPGYINIPQDWSNDGQAIIYFSFNDRDPGTYYLFRPREGRLIQLHALGEHLQKVPMGHTDPIEFTARDGAKIFGYVTYPPDFSGDHPAPLVVDIHGGPMARDIWSFSSTNQFLATRGYVVLQVNYRGSSGYGGEYQKKGLYSRLDTVVLDDIADGAQHLIKTGVADPARVAVMGASFGGWATYMSLIKYPDLYRAGIAIAAVSHWKQQLKHDRNFYRNRSGAEFWKDLLRREDFAINEKYIDPLMRAAELKQPIYIMHGEQDDVVDVSESQRMLAALKKTNPNVESKFFYGATHTIWPFSVQVTRLNEIETFLRKNLAKPPEKKATP